MSGAQAWACLLLATVAAPGCALFQVAAQQDRVEAAVHLSGSLDTGHPAGGPLVAVLVAHVEDGPARVVDHLVLREAGAFSFAAIDPGSYSVAAFVDLDRDLVYDPGEPGRASDASAAFDLAPGEARSGIALHIGADERAPVSGPLDIRSLTAASAHEGVGRTLGQLGAAGEVVSLDDPRFARERGQQGMWKPVDFVLEVGGGVYFAEPFDPGRIPVLFVHGIEGTPRDFSYLVSSLDTARFQAWFYYYPSGAKLTSAASHLSRTLRELELLHGVEELVVVAHSMGGLVAREFLLLHAASGSTTPRLFVSFSTPWSGHDSAALGVRYAPRAVYSWIDVAPGSEFLRRLFWSDAAGTRRRRLPASVPHHLMFGFRRDDTIPGICTDRVVALSSQLRDEAQEEATTIFGYDADHSEILRDPEVAARLHRLLADGPAPEALASAR